MPSYKHHKGNNLNYPFSSDNLEGKNKNKDTAKSVHFLKSSPISLTGEPPSIPSIFM